MYKIISRNEKLVVMKYSAIAGAKRDTRYKYTPKYYITLKPRALRDFGFYGDGIVCRRCGKHI